MRYSLSILKPDCIERGLENKIRSLLKQNGFSILLEKRLRLTKDDVAFIYERCIDKDFFEGLSDFLTSGDVIVLVVSGLKMADVVKKLNSLVGHIDPCLAKDGTIRWLGESIRRNLVHSSADTTSFWREVSRIFSEKEIHNAGLG